MTELSILIPARNEMFLARTIENILNNIEGDTEIITVLDGVWADPPILQHDRVTVIHHSESIGQRAATNEAARLSKAKYVMKCDAHCAFDKGFDVKMLSAIKGHDNWTMAPLMRNLHAFDWVCTDGHRRYQGPSGPCVNCGKETKRDIVWIAKESPKSVSYCFDSTPHFQYFGDFSRRAEGQGDVTESMSLQGSCWMLTREKYWELNVCDEAFGSWGSQGIEVAAKTWLSGGRVMINKKTWYAHLFRTQGGDFSFPYPISGKQQEHAKKYARDLFFNNKWSKQVHPLSWLVERFWPVPGWTDEDLKNLKANTFKFSEKGSTQKPAESEPQPDQTSGTLYNSGEIFPSNQLSGSTEKHSNGSNEKVPEKGIIFYTNNQLNLKIAHTVQKNLKNISHEKGLPIICTTLKQMTFGDKNIYFPHLKSSYLTTFKQILAGLEHSKANIIFLCEHDVLYDPTHFDFTPGNINKFYYNVNLWQTNIGTSDEVKIDNCRQTLGLCAYRKVLLRHYKKRLAILEKKAKKLTDSDFNKYIIQMGFEPGVHTRKERVDNYTSSIWESEQPNKVIKHDSAPNYVNRPEYVSKQILYYTCNTHKPEIDNACRSQLLKAGLPIVSVSLNKDLDFGNKKLRIDGERGALMMHKQIVMGLKVCTADFVFLAESDVLYHPSHFTFLPERRDVFYFNTNVWKVRYPDGHAVWTDDMQQLSGMVASRELLLEFFTKRLAQINKEGFNKHYEPSPRQNILKIQKNGKYGQEGYVSKIPNICIRHDKNLTKSKWSIDEFNNKKFAKGWKENDEVMGWGKTKDLITKF